MYKVKQEDCEDFPLKYKLLIKNHRETGINYLCITKRKDFYSYLGSGTRWQRLIKSIPSKIDTCILFASDNIEEFNEECLLYSKLFNIPENKDFANLIIEGGISSRPYNEHKRFSSISRQKLSNNGKNSYKNRISMFDPKYDDIKSEWARVGGTSVRSRGGWASEEYRKNNPEKLKQTCSKAGKIGGSITGNLLWWTNGKSNKRSMINPGEGFHRGMTKGINK